MVVDIVHFAMCGQPASKIDVHGSSLSEKSNIGKAVETEASGRNEPDYN